MLSWIGKLFTSIINERLNKYLNDNHLIGEEQAGFRENYSTTDHIFVLHSTLDLYLSQNKRIYCAFIDYKKAFDSIDRTSLWQKLFQNGVRGKVFRVIRNMYANLKSCVMNNNETSKFFKCNIGVRQGENLSPILFALYLNDFQTFIKVISQDHKSTCWRSKKSSDFSTCFFGGSTSTSVTTTCGIWGLSFSLFRFMAALE